MRLLVNNKITSDSQLTVNGEISRYPKANLYSDILVTKTRYTNYIVVDFGTAKKVTAIGLIGHSLTTTIEANTADSWGSPAYTTSLTSSETVKYIDQTYRYWRVYNSTGVDFLNFLYLGEYIQMPGSTPGSTPQRRTTDVNVVSLNGNIYSTRGIKFYEHNFTFPAVSETNWQLFDDWWESSNRVRSLIFDQFEDGNTDYPPYFARILEYEITNRNYDAVSFRIAVREAK